MLDAVGYRAKMGVVIPSTNTVVEHDYNLIRSEGVTFHVGRMYVSDASLDSDASFEHLVNEISDSMETALRDVLTAKPTYLMLGVSAGTFWGGIQGNADIEAKVAELTGLGVSTGATACRAALGIYDAGRVAILSPYQPIADQIVSRFFEQAGFEVVRFRGLRCPSATSISNTMTPMLRRILWDELDGPDVDAIVQVGTNLSMMGLADEAERALRKPVIAINAATLWHALRANGIGDKFHGFGSLLREF